MRRITTIALTVVLIVSMIGAVAFTGAAAANEVEEVSEDIAPGERLGGVVGVVEAELAGDIDERGFGLAIAKAASDEAKADVVASQLTDVDNRLDELEEQRLTLEEQREAGEITEGKYQAEIAKLAVETKTVERLTHTSEEVAGELPADLLESKGINVSAIQTLKDRSDELSGPEVAAIAQTIAGEGTGAPIGPDRDGVPPVEIPERPETPGDESADDGESASEGPDTEEQQPNDPGDDVTENDGD